MNQYIETNMNVSVAWNQPLNRQDGTFGGPRDWTKKRHIYIHENTEVANIDILSSGSELLVSSGIEPLDISKYRNGGSGGFTQ